MNEYDMSEPILAPIELKPEATGELVGLLAEISDEARDGQLRFFPNEFLGGWVLECETGFGTENFEIRLVIQAHTDAAQ